MSLSIVINIENVIVSCFHSISSSQWTLIKLGSSSDGQAPVEVNYEMTSIHQTVTGSQNVSTDPITTNQCPAYGVVSQHN